MPERQRRLYLVFVLQFARERREVSQVMEHHPSPGLDIPGSPDRHPAEISHHAVVSYQVGLHLLGFAVELDRFPEVRQAGGDSYILHHSA